MALHLPSSLLCSVAWSGGRWHLLNGQMRMLSGSTGKRNLRKASWVGPRGGELRSICHLPEMVTEDGKASSNDAQLKADVQNTPNSRCTAQTSEYLGKRDMTCISLVGHLRLPSGGQVSSTHGAHVKMGLRGTVAA